MNMDVVKKMYHLNYSTELSLEEFERNLQKGIELLKLNNTTDKLFMSRFYSLEDQKAINLALEYNQELMVILLQS